MKNYNMIVKAKPSQKGTFNKNKIKDFLRNELGYSFSPVKGSNNTFWIHGQIIENKFHEFMSGSKYYKLVVNARDFGVSASGDCNAFAMAGEIKDGMYKHALAQEAK